MSPPMTMTWPLRARTTLSDSRIWLNASGRSLVEFANDTRLVWSVTSLTFGWTCSRTEPSSLICGVTSSATPEKNGVGGGGGGGGGGGRRRGEEGGQRAG